MKNQERGVGGGRKKGINSREKKKMKRKQYKMGDRVKKVYKKEG